MSMSPPAPDRRRVRHQAREALAVMAFSASMSVGIAAVFLVVTAFGRQG